MTKAELVKELEKYPDDFRIYFKWITISGDFVFENINMIKTSAFNIKGEEVLVEEDKDKNAIILELG